MKFNITCASRVALVGRNGSGKSTLLSLLAGRLDPTRGEVGRHSRLRLGYYSQHFDALLPTGPKDTSAAKYLQAHAAALGKSFELEEGECRKMLGRFGLDGDQHLIRLSELSGGQKSRVVMATLAASRPHILVLDEPTNHLDMESVEALAEGLRQFDGGVILATHDARLIEETHADLWVCGETEDAETGLRGIRWERAGLGAYRKKVCREIDEQALEMERAIAARADARAVRAAQRKARTTKHKKGKGRE